MQEEEDNQTQQQQQQQQQHHRPYIVTIEGNIGCGKTSLLEALKRFYSDETTPLLRVGFVEEPVHLWETIQDDHGVNALELFYQDQSRYAFFFQCVVCTTLHKTVCQFIQDHPDLDVIVVERSVEAAVNVFAKMLKEDAKLSRMEHAIFLQMVEPLIRETRVDGIIQLDAPTDICKQRILTRNRKGEQDICIHYLTRLQQFVNQWVEKNDTATAKLLLDVSQHIAEDDYSTVDWVKQIDDFLRFYFQW